MDFERVQKVTGVLIWVSLTRVRRMMVVVARRLIAFDWCSWFTALALWVGGCLWEGGKSVVSRWGEAEWGWWKLNKGPEIMD